MKFSSFQITKEELCGFLGLQESHFDSFVADKLVTFSGSEKCDVVTLLQCMVMRDLIALNVDDNCIRDVAEALDGRSFTEECISAVPFVIAYDGTPQYIQLTIFPWGDVLVVVKTLKATYYQSSKHGDITVPFGGTAPEWAHLYPTTVLVSLDAYLDRVRSRIKITKTDDDVAVDIAL